MTVKQVQPTGGQFGYTALQTKGWQLTAPFENSTTVTIPKGTVVALTTEGKIVTAATNGTASLVVGITAEPVDGSGYGLVTVKGIAEDVACDGSVAAGGILKVSGTTAGKVAATASPAAGEAVGVAIAASASNVVDVWISRSL